MAKVNIARLREAIQKFELANIFVEILGWNNPPQKMARTIQAADQRLAVQAIAELGGLQVFRVVSERGAIPTQAERNLIETELTKLAHEHIAVFLDDATRPTRMLWYWSKRQDGKRHPRPHLYAKGQPGDLFISNIVRLFVAMEELDDKGQIGITKVLGRVRAALDVEKTTKKFFTGYQERHDDLVESIQGIKHDRDRRWYASVILHRLMFVWFLQKKLFLDNGNESYLTDKLEQAKKLGKNQYYDTFLKALFFEAFAKPEDQRSNEARKLTGSIPYLNGGLFLRHPVELRYPKIAIADKAFESLFDLFAKYSWNLNDTAEGRDDEINPDVLGYIFEKYINQKAFGAYYTPPEITEYLCEQTVHRAILARVNSHPEDKLVGGLPEWHFDTVAEMLLGLDDDLARHLIENVLKNLSILDPACGSGAFLIAAQKTLTRIYTAIAGYAEGQKGGYARTWLNALGKEHKNKDYALRRQIVTDNLFGVDIMPEAVEVAKLRLFLSLVATARNVDELEPLPNIDFNLLAGNSLIGCLRVDEEQFQATTVDMFAPTKSYKQILNEKNNKIDVYRHTANYEKSLATMRAEIEELKKEAYKTLDKVLRDDMAHLGVKYEQQVWDDKAKKLVKPEKRELTVQDIRALTPFHWGFEFDQVLNVRGGFDVILANPPWEVFKPYDKEFLANHSDLVSKNKMRIEDFEKELAKWLKDPEIKESYLDYLSSFPHVSQYYRALAAPLIGEDVKKQKRKSAEAVHKNQYEAQSAVVNGKKTGSDLNLYKLFTEQCYNLLRTGGECGIVIPSGFYTDQGATGLRNLVFEQTKVTGLFCFENRKAVFEGVDSRFKFILLTFEKGGTTTSFPATFMRHNVSDLGNFPDTLGLELDVELIRRMSPGTNGLMEFKSELDVLIAEKMLKFPLLGETLPDTWNVKFGNELHMTNDSDIFETTPGKNKLPLYEGKMMHQFDHRFAEPRYWVEEAKGRARVLGKHQDTGQQLEYQGYRIAYRAIGRNTDERTMICTALPECFVGNSLICSVNELTGVAALQLVCILNSYVLDAFLRQKVTANVNMVYVYQLPIPRKLDAKTEGALVERAARLICTTPEYDGLAKEVGLGSHKKGATEPTERARLRAEIDGLVAHVYGLTHDEFAHILASFPLVDQSVKDAALAAYDAL